MTETAVSGGSEFRDRRDGDASTSIRFLAQAPQATEAGVEFQAIVDQQPVECVLTTGALQHRFGLIGDDAEAKLAAFETYRYSIEQSVHGLITAGRVNDRRLVIGPDDVR
ncbi:MAG: hypothetical protein JWO51_2831 [Rhodospirillales bacterium]|nr:hypothetical protein [Rhodospirillales bacterium]